MVGGSAESLFAASLLKVVRVGIVGSSDPMGGRLTGSKVGLCAVVILDVEESVGLFKYQGRKSVMSVGLAIGDRGVAIRLPRLAVAAVVWDG